MGICLAPDTSTGDLPCSLITNMWRLTVQDQRNVSPVSKEKVLEDTASQRSESLGDHTHRKAILVIPSPGAEVLQVWLLTPGITWERVRDARSRPPTDVLNPPSAQFWLPLSPRTGT